MFQQEITVIDNQVHVCLSGSIYEEEMLPLRKELIGYIAKGHKAFVLDFGNVDYIDSGGLGALVAFQKWALQANGHIIIKNLKGLVKDVFEAMRLTKVFDIQ